MRCTRMIQVHTYIISLSLHSFHTRDRAQGHRLYNLTVKLLVNIRSFIMSNIAIILYKTWFHTPIPITLHKTWFHTLIPITLY